MTYHKPGAVVWHSILQCSPSFSDSAHFSLILATLVLHFLRKVYHLTSSAVLLWKILPKALVTKEVLQGRLNLGIVFYTDPKAIKTLFLVVSGVRDMTEASSCSYRDQNKMEHLWCLIDLAVKKILVECNAHICLCPHIYTQKKKTLGC